MKPGTRMAGMLAAALAAGLAGMPPAGAQKAAEQFIPIGQSPGLSGEHTRIGRIAAVDPLRRSVTLAVDGKQETALVTPRTHIWLERSQLKLPNVSGDMSDLLPGRRAELKFADADPGEAEWVKVELGAP